MDPDYADRIGSVLTGLTPAVSTLGLSVTARTIEQAIVPARPGMPWRCSQSPRPALDIFSRMIGATAVNTATPYDLIDWAAGTGRALAELVTQLTDAKTGS